MLNEILNDLPELEDGKNICIALSGGLDSTTLVYTLVHKYGKERVKALAFDFGQRHSIELDMAKKTSDFLKINFQIIELKYMKDFGKDVSALFKDSELKPKTAEENAGDPQVNTYVPFRNMQFAAVTAAFAEATECQYIAQGLNQVDEYAYWDTSSSFTKAINNILTLNRQNNIKFIAPFIEMYKVDELVLAKELSVEFSTDILLNTWSCYNGDTGSGKECGICNTCREKLTGYVQAEFTDEQILNKFEISPSELIEYREQVG